MKMATIPLHIVEDHSDILEPILKCVGSKKIAFQDNLLIHFDAHPDFLVNTELKASEIYEKQILLDKVSIETWILPLAFAGHVTSIVWVKPEWARQIDDGSFSFVIGEDIHGNIKVSLPNLYFISALNYAPKRELTNEREINLHVITLENSVESSQKCLDSLRRIISVRENYQYILDIDLDFFATCNPFLSLFSECNTYNILRTVYEFRETELSPSPEAAVAKRSKQLHQLETIFKDLEICQLENPSEVTDFIDNKISPSSFQSSKAHDMFCQMCKNIIRSNSNNPIDWMLIHDAGTTIDDPIRELPNHNDQSDTDSYLGHFRTIVEDLQRPTLISIARSSLDEYCPPDCVERIQKSVLRTLTERFKTKIYDMYSQLEPL